MIFDDVIVLKLWKKVVKVKLRYKDDFKFEFYYVNFLKLLKKGIKIKDDDDDGLEFFLINYGVDDVEDYKIIFKLKRMEFIGWGFKLFIEFLIFIGEDIREEMF